MVAWAADRARGRSSWSPSRGVAGALAGLRAACAGIVVADRRCPGRRAVPADRARASRRSPRRWPGSWSPRRRSSPRCSRSGSTTRSARRGCASWAIVLGVAGVAAAARASTSAAPATSLLGGLAVLLAGLGYAIGGLLVKHRLAGTAADRRRRLGDGRRQRVLPAAGRDRRLRRLAPPALGPAGRGRRARRRRHRPRLRDLLRAVATVGPARAYIGHLPRARVRGRLRRDPASASRSRSATVCGLALILAGSCLAARELRRRAAPREGPARRAGESRCRSLVHQEGKLSKSLKLGVAVLAVGSVSRGPDHRHRRDRDHRRSMVGSNVVNSARRGPRRLRQRDPARQPRQAARLLTRSRTSKLEKQVTGAFIHKGAAGADRPADHHPVQGLRSHSPVQRLRARSAQADRPAPQAQAEPALRRHRHPATTPTARSAVS